MRAKLKIGLVCLGLLLMLWVCTWLHAQLISAYEQSESLNHQQYSWFFNLVLNLAGYSMIIAPGYILYKYLQRTNYFDKISGNGAVSRVLLQCFGEAEQLGEPPAAPAPGRDLAELALCFTGLMGAYLVWGLLQEKIMTRAYAVGGEQLRWGDAQLLVLVNRAAGLAAGAVALGARGGGLPRPAFPFSYCALSNVLSAWCQYEALKYVSFPTQVLSKSCKVVGVMAMGRVVSRASYERHEYASAALITAGMVLFVGGGGVRAAASEAGAAGAGAGLVLLLVYQASDSFTSSWQAALFARTGARPLQMLVAVNAFSCALTAPALLRLSPERLRLLRSGAFSCDVALLSLSSALGQLLIYRTIARFGALVFAFIMTLRQAVSILLSCLVYGHPVGASGAAGVTLVFAAVFMRLYCAHRKRTRDRRRVVNT